MQNESNYLQSKVTPHQNKLVALFQELDIRNANNDFFVHFSTSTFGNKKSNGEGGTSFGGKPAVKKTAHINNGIIEKIIKICAHLGIRAVIKPEYKPEKLDDKNSLIPVFCSVQLFDMDKPDFPPLYDITDGTEHNFGQKQSPVKSALTDAKKRAFYGLGVLGDLRNIPELYVDEKHTDLNKYLYEALSIHLNAQEGDEQTFSENDCFFITTKMIGNTKYAVLEWYKKGNTQTPMNYKGNSHIIQWEYKPAEAAVEKKDEKQQQQQQQKKVDLPLESIPIKWIEAGFATKNLEISLSTCTLIENNTVIQFLHSKLGKTYYFNRSEDNNETFNLLVKALMATR